MLAQVLAMALCLSVFFCHKSELYRNGWTNRAGFWHRSFLSPFLYGVKRKFRYLQNKSTSLWNCVPNSGLRKLFGISIVETCYWLSSRKYACMYYVATDDTCYYFLRFFRIKMVTSNNIYCMLRTGCFGVVHDIQHLLRCIATLQPFTDNSEISKSVFSFLRQLTAWHCPH